VWENNFLRGVRRDSTRTDAFQDEHQMQVSMPNLKERCCAGARVMINRVLKRGESWNETL
jgi:hypothetical protein